MPAYVIFIRDRMRDADEFKTYAEKVPAARVGHDMTTLARYGKLKTVEGAEAEGVVLIQFPTFAEAEAWYHSDAYQEAARHRHLGSDYRAIIFEGV